MVYTLAGFLLGCLWHIDFVLLVATMVGIALVIASACVCNNYIDRDLDRKMSRTQKRALATGTVPIANALIYAAILGVTGFAILLIYVNTLTALLGASAFLVYVVAYGYAKRTTVHGTLVGSIAGAVPPVAGYTAATGHFDTAALILFLTVVFWQMPHFYSIAIYRFKDYKAAGLPVLPVKKGLRQTKIQILLYIAVFTVTASMLTFAGNTGFVYLAVILFIGSWWFIKGLRGFNSGNSETWARKMFLFSLIVTIVFSVMVSVGPVLP